MKTLLIPLNSSTPAENLLKYAADFSCDAHIERVIILKSFHISVYATLLPSPDFVQLSPETIEQERQTITAELKTLAKELLKKCNPGTTVETQISDMPMLRAIHETIEQHHPYMVMIGSHNDIEDNYNADQVIAIAKTSTVPVMIVPNHINYKKIEKALVPCDVAAIERLHTLKRFSDPTKFLHPALLVLNVGTGEAHVPLKKELTDSIKDALSDYEYEVHHTENSDIVNGILHYADNHHVQLIIALPGKYSFFYNLTHKNITKALALNSHRAVLILK